MGRRKHDSQGPAPGRPLAGNLVRSNALMDWDCLEC
jgi:hypothetical protein